MCPNCGYCPHCGRSGQHVAPTAWPFYPNNVPLQPTWITAPVITVAPLTVGANVAPLTVGMPILTTGANN